jgi:cephalosporin hydroxylase
VTKDFAPTIDAFHRLYYGDHAPKTTSGRQHHTTYHGIETHKCPLDLWIYQELLHQIKPALVVELGTYRGGSTLFLAHQLELLGGGSVVSVDCVELPRPRHSRITYLLGRTADLQIVDAVRQLVPADATSPVVVIHDADHHYDAVVEDLELYAPLVTPGSYLIVEDSNVNGHPVLHSWGPGPWEAIDDFLPRHPEFVRDENCEKFFLTYNPGGYLRRVAK